MTPGNQPTAPPKQNIALRAVAEKLEASFLAEMLKSVGVGEQENSFSGGVGEDQFASFLRQALANKMVSSGGIGLAESFYNSLMEKSNDT
nr:rod-binding protein [Roseovarius litorisediminis]